MIKKAKRCLKKLDLFDVWSIKVSSALFILFLMTAWPAFNDLVMRVHWGWFLGIVIVLMARPFMKWVRA